MSYYCSAIAYALLHYAHVMQILRNTGKYCDFMEIMEFHQIWDLDLRSKMAISEHNPPQIGNKYMP